jgi:hypothetical protein
LAPSAFIMPGLFLVFRRFTAILRRISPLIACLRKRNTADFGPIGLIRSDRSSLLRIAALAFGILAGLVASFILALGGLDAAELGHLDGRQMQLVDFGLFVVANLGVLGAGLVLAAPLAGLVLFVLGAVGWVAAAVVLRHGPDYVMLTPPAILTVAIVLAAVALFRRRSHDRDVLDDDDDGDERTARERAPKRRAALAAVPRRLADEVEEPVDDAEDRGSVSVGASFFGDSGTAMPLRGAMPSLADEELLRGLGRSDRQPIDQRDWQPVRRRVEPPRQKPMFRPPEDEYDDEESGFSQFARVASSILSFGLYAALAASALLIVFNLQQGASERPTATRIETSSAAPAGPAPVLAPTPAPSEAVAESPAGSASLPPIALASEQPAAPVLAGPSGLAVPAAGAAAPVIASAPSIPADLRASQPPQQQRQQPFAFPGVVIADGPSLDSAAEPPPASDQSSAADVPAADAPTAPGATPVPFPMPAAIAAQRAGGVGPVATPGGQRTQPATRTDTGL